MKCIPLLIMAIALLMGALGMYLSFKSMKNSSGTQVTDIAKIIDESQCLESYPGVCKRACITEISQMGINWGKLLPNEDQKCIPKPSECCCQINQMDIQTVTRCTDKSSCVGFDQGVQGQKCLPRNEYPLVNGNRSEVCGLSTEDFCAMEQTLGSRILSTQIFMKWVGYVITFCAIPVFLSGLIKISENCMGCDLSCLANSIGCISMCLAVVAFLGINTFVFFLSMGNKALEDLCDTAPWSKTSVDCVPNCQTAVDSVMTKAACPMVKELDNIKVASMVLDGFIAVACFLICAMMCSETRTEKNHRKYYAVPPSGPPRAVGNTGGYATQHFQPGYAAATPQQYPQQAYIPPVVHDYNQITATS